MVSMTGDQLIIWLVLLRRRYSHADCNFRSNSDRRRCVVRPSLAAVVADDVQTELLPHLMVLVSLTGRTSTAGVRAVLLRLSAIRLSHEFALSGDIILHSASICLLSFSFILYISAVCLICFDDTLVIGPQTAPMIHGTIVCLSSFLIKI
jgi:hypothetical protein